MKLLAKLFLIVVVFTTFTSIVAQNSATANVPVTIQLAKGLSISLTSGDLNYGEVILDGTAQTPAKTPDNGALLTVVGHPTKSVDITFANATLDNNAWVTSNGGTNDNLSFIPFIEHTATSTYASGNTVNSGNNYGLTNSGGSGYIYLWVGGSIGIGATQEPGDYLGTFSVTVAY